MNTDTKAGHFASNTARLLHLADATRKAASQRPALTIDANLMALVYEVAAGLPGALDALRERV